MSDSLIVYGHPASQPSRTVFWACLMHNLPFTLGVSDTGDVGYGGTNPRGQVPSIIDGGFDLAESCAIVCYLADKHGWNGLYPSQPEKRARINQFLHMHHGLVRLATLKLMAPHVVKPLGSALRNSGGDNPLSILNDEILDAALASNAPLQDGRQVVHTIVGFLERSYLTGNSAFVCGTDRASVADLVCYSELGQLQFAGLFDFAGYPKSQRWLKAMSAVSHHDSIHAYNAHLGDIAARPNTMERFTTASQAGFAALRATGLVT